jgi:hypothetical protein
MTRDKQYADQTKVMVAMKKVKRAPWTKSHDKALRAHSKRKTPVVKISKDMKRTVAALRQRASILGIALGHQR